MSIHALGFLDLEPDKQKEIYHGFVKSIMTKNDIWNITGAELVERILIKLLKNSFNNFTNEVLESFCSFE